ncbi:hypothetical protein TorRG33x02_267150 [Trema orientale]|uniref:Uncharacterized protein n=1 Tax=Trema orientale TaxID=63057 RepID=A0A2P5D040_TREOI|nr:hypothetical protein TorRG33x02_267150 [Trema orientale]
MNSARQPVLKDVSILGLPKSHVLEGHHVLRPELTMGTSKLLMVTSSLCFGLQVLHKKRWIDVRPIPWAFDC